MVPEPIERVVSLAWNKTPQERPSFSQIVSRLQEAAGGEEEERFTVRRDTGLPDTSLLPTHNSRMSNEELKKKVNTHGYVLPENSYQYRYSVCTNTHLNNSSPKPFSKAAASSKPVKKVEFETEEKGRSVKNKRGDNSSPKVLLRVGSGNSEETLAEVEDKKRDVTGEGVNLCVEQEPGTTDL